MSEPYDGPDCPFCGSTATLAWARATAARTGYRSECRACGTRWDFPAASDITELSPVTWNIASAAFAAVSPSPGGGAS